ncbi:hypothetical protein RYA05_04980 [Pseudomonas syringae pv. actinidiae]|nr:hypothetical protein [Pseudomonas syringae pv. actinidiae]
MKYSELVNKTLDEVGHTAYGIVVDELILDKKPDFLVRLGFELESLDVTDLNNYALNVMISYLSTGEFNREIIAEIPAHLEVDARTLLMLSGCKISISLLPPRSDEDTDWIAYTEKLKKVFTSWLTDSNMHRAVYPIAGYYEYLVLEQLGYVPERITDDEYTLKRYVDEFDGDRMDEVKDRLKDHLISFFGSEAEFKAFIDSVGLGVHKRAEIECRDMIELIERNQPTQEDQALTGPRNEVIS